MEVTMEKKYLLTTIHTFKFELDFSRQKIFIIVPFDAVRKSAAFKIDISPEELKKIQEKIDEAEKIFLECFPPEGSA
jgi:hypothetical protein